MSRKIHKLDAERTELAGFRDSRRYWTVTGKVYLFGRDMMRQREEVHARDAGKCVACGKVQSLFEMELDHYPISRGQGGDDSMSNLRTLCFDCHRARHPQVQLRSMK